MKYYATDDILIKADNSIKKHKNADLYLIDNHVFVSAGKRNSYLNKYTNEMYFESEFTKELNELFNNPTMEMMSEFGDKYDFSIYGTDDNDFCLIGVTSIINISTREIIAKSKFLECARNNSFLRENFRMVVNDEVKEFFLVKKCNNLFGTMVISDVEMFQPFDFRESVLHGYDLSAISKCSFEDKTIVTNSNNAIIVPNSYEVSYDGTGMIISGNKRFFYFSDYEFVEFFLNDFIEVEGYTYYSEENDDRHQHELDMMFFRSNDNTYYIDSLMFETTLPIQRIDNMFILYSKYVFEINNETKTMSSVKNTEVFNAKNKTHIVQGNKVIKTINIQCKKNKEKLFA